MLISEDANATFHIAHSAIVPEKGLTSPPAGGITPIMTVSIPVAVALTTFVPPCTPSLKALVLVALRYVPAHQAPALRLFPHFGPVSVVEVLVEAIDKKGRYYSGRTPHNKIVHIINAGPACLGKIICVEISEANGSNLKGFYVDAERMDRGQSLIKYKRPPPLLELDC